MMTEILNEEDSNQSYFVDDKIANPFFIHREEKEDKKIWMTTDGIGLHWPWNG